MADTLHFPFAMYEDIEPLIYENRLDFLSNLPPCFSPTGWVTEGVTTRLRVSEVTPPDNDNYDTNLDQLVELAGGTVGDYGYTRLNPDEPLVTHATHDKAHLMGGYWRYTPGGILISETRSVSIRIRKAGNWGTAGSLGQVTHHDRSNSV